MTRLEINDQRLGLSIERKPLDIRVLDIDEAEPLFAYLPCGV